MPSHNLLSLRAELLSKSKAQSHKSMFQQELVNRALRAHMPLPWAIMSVQVVIETIVHRLIIDRIDAIKCVVNTKWPWTQPA